MQGPDAGPQVSPVTFYLGGVRVYVPCPNCGGRLTTCLTLTDYKLLTVCGAPNCGWEETDEQ